MRKLSIFIILFFCLLTVGAQQVSLQDVANRTYRADVGWGTLHPNEY